MKIAYVLYPNAVLSGDSNGIKSQAKIWKKGLVKLGHDVFEVNSWNNYNWQNFDIIHVFGTGLWVNSFVKGLFEKNKNIVFSPIIDTVQSPFKYKLSTFLGIEKLRLWSPTYALKKTLPYVKGVFVRSDYESVFFEKSMSFSKNKIYKVMLPYELDSNKSFQEIKENFCLHISSIYHDRKNVLRLIKAAKKFNFKLVLAGSKGTDKQFQKIKEEIKDSENITVLGFITEDEMIDLYKKAKVFALPSISEGVGIVALNAANFGCDIVITNIGGPKEYYYNLAKIVNPYSVDDIGLAVKELLNGKTYQPKLKKIIRSEFSNSRIARDISNIYSNL